MKSAPVETFAMVNHWQKMIQSFHATANGAWCCARTSMNRTVCLVALTGCNQLHFCLDWFVQLFNAQDICSPNLGGSQRVNQCERCHSTELMGLTVSRKTVRVSLFTSKHPLPNLFSLLFDEYKSRIGKSTIEYIGHDAYRNRRRKAC